VDSRAGLNDVEKRKFLTLQGLELRPSVNQPEARRYTDYATSAPGLDWIVILKWILSNMVAKCELDLSDLDG
jgi:hypothetical protein